MLCAESWKLLITHPCGLKAVCFFLCRSICKYEKKKKTSFDDIWFFLSFSWLSGLFFFFSLFWIIMTYFNVILLVHSKTFIVFVLSKVPAATRLPTVAYHVYRNSYFVHLPKAHLALSQVFLKFNLFISIQKPLNTWVYIYFFRYKKNRSLLPTKHTSLEIKMLQTKRINFC